MCNSYSGCSKQSDSKMMLHSLPGTLPDMMILLSNKLVARNDVFRCAFLLIACCPAKQETIRAGSHPVYGNHDHELLSRYRTASNQATPTGYKRVVSRRSNTECDLQRLQ